MRRGILCSLVTCAVLSVVSIAQAAAPHYSIRDLGTFGSQYTSSYGCGINNSGVVVGYVRDGNDRAFMWSSDTGMVDITPENSLMGHAYAINDNGVIAGDNGQSPAYLARTDIYGRTLSNVSSGMSVQPYAINDSGWIVGGCGAYPKRAIVWREGVGMTTIPTLGGPGDCYASGINNAGKVVGSTSATGGLPCAFWWTESDGTQQLDTLGGACSGANAINDSGWIVGDSQLPGPNIDLQPFHACLWKPGEAPIDLGCLLSGYNSYALGINESGVVVGYGVTSGYARHALVWTAESGMWDLNSTLVDGTGWSLERAMAINDGGQIVGYGLHDGRRRAFLLTPVPEPSSLLALACGLGGLAGMVRRKK